MADALNIEIVSPERLVLSETAQSVTVPGTEGYFTVMADHAPLMSTLKPGFVTVTGADGTARAFYVRGGFADVSPEGLTILAEESVPGTEFSRAIIEAEIRAAQAALAAAETPEDKSAAQTLLDGWNNLMIEAANFGPTVSLGDS